MNRIGIKTAAILLGALTTFSGNIILHLKANKTESKIALSNEAIIKKTALIQLAKTKPQPENTISHRLALPVNRISVGDDLQGISKSLQIERLDFQISPEINLAKTASLDAYSESTVELKFSNSSDQPIFKMVTKIMDEFPGIVLPKEIVIWRNYESKTPQIHGHFRFNWLKNLNDKDEA